MTCIAETHISWVLTIGDSVYKWKKPVRFDFIDLSTVQARRRDCEREVELNRRLAPDVYRGVAEVRGVDGMPCDYLVVMKRMPVHRSLARLVAENDAGAGTAVDDVAITVADFHRRACRGPEVDVHGGPDAVLRKLEADIAGLRPFAGVLFDSAVLDGIDAMAHRYVAGRKSLLEDRVRARHVVDGHGDLLADDIYILADGPRLLDCLEFDDALRCGDVVADISFLAMDLERLAAPRLAHQLLATYRWRSGEDWPASLGDFYVATRAVIRAKVACLRNDGEAAGELLVLASRHLRDSAVRLVLVGGLPGTGKSTIARALAGEMGAALLRSDQLRKELVGLDPFQSAVAAFGEGLYREEMTAATYAAMLSDARRHLEAGRSVVLDATWTRACWREEAAAVAGRTASDLVEMQCTAPAEVTQYRMLERSRRGGDVSDATADIASLMASGAEPWPSASCIDTSGSEDESLHLALQAVRRVPTGLGD